MLTMRNRSCCRTQKDHKSFWFQENFQLVLQFSFSAVNNVIVLNNASYYSKQFNKMSTFALEKKNIYNFLKK